MITPTKDLLGYIAVAISVFGYGSYFISLFRRHTKPHTCSWVIWGLILSIVCFVQLGKGGGSGAWATGSSALFCSIIAIASFFIGEKTITRDDWMAFALALLIIPIWYMTEAPLIVVILATLIDGLAYYPTFRKCYRKPREENITTYAVDAIKWVVALLALKNYSVVTILYPFFLIFANSALTFMVLKRRAEEKR